MLHLSLLNLIVSNLLTARIKCAVIFHCWQLETQYAFHTLAEENLLYTQDVDMNRYNLSNQEIYEILQNKLPRMGVFIDMNCVAASQVLNVSSEALFYSEHYHWLIYDELANITNFRSYFVNASLSVNADMTYAILKSRSNDTHQTNYIFYDVYNNGHFIGGKLNITIDREIICDSCNCHLKEYLSKLHLRSKYGNRNRLSDVTFRISNVVTKYPINRAHEEIQSYLSTMENPHLDAVPRFGHRLVGLFKDMIGCNMTHIYANSWSTSELFGGMIGELTNNTVDMVSTPFFVTPGRLRYFTIISNDGKFRTVCIFRTPRNAGMQESVFLAPFTATVWMIFGLFLFIFSVLLWYIFRVEYRLLRRCIEFLPSMLTTFLISFGSACCQGSFLIPRSTGGRLVFCTLSLISFLMYNYYTSIVVSSLLGAPVKSKIKTLAQLADSNLEVGLESVVYTKVYLNTSQLPEVRRFVKRKIESKKNPQSVWMRVEEGVVRVRDKPGYVFVFESATGYAVLEKFYEPHEICDLNEIDLRPEQSIYIQLNKKSSYKELIRLKVTRLMETGVYFKHRGYWLRTQLNCFANNFVIDVGMEYAAPLFCLLMGSYFLVLVVLAIEILHYKRKMKVSNK